MKMVVMKRGSERGFGNRRRRRRGFGEGGFGKKRREEGLIERRPWEGEMEMGLMLGLDSAERFHSLLSLSLKPET